MTLRDQAVAVFSRSFLSATKKELGALWLRLRCFSPANLLRLRKLRARDALQLNIGAGKHQVNGWVSVDLALQGQGLRWDLRWGLPLRSGSVARIHCEHFLEHIEYPDASSRFLRSCARVLARGGHMRVVVPDAGRYIQAYVADDGEFWGALKDLGGVSPPFRTRIEIINQCFRMGGSHLFAYDGETLGLALSEAGFTETVAGEYSPGEHLDQGDAWRLVESIYVTAFKR